MRTPKLVLGVSAWLLLLPSPARAAMVHVDFATDLAGNTLENGRSVADRDFGGLFVLSGNGQNHGPAVFDSTPGGPNTGGGDPDLLVGQGNLLILQNRDFSAQKEPGVFARPDDSSRRGALAFAFANPVALLSIMLVDHDGSPSEGEWVFTLADTGGRLRVFVVPKGATPDGGTVTLDFTVGGTSSPGFDPGGVSRLDVAVRGSGAFDDLTFETAPGPTALVLLGLGLGALSALRRGGASAGA